MHAQEQDRQVTKQALQLRARTPSVSVRLCHRVPFVTRTLQLSQALGLDILLAINLLQSNVSLGFQILRLLSFRGRHLRLAKLNLFF